jgi:beta-1,4-mannosyl-glycoprotein beta-1,4-N-acetylglucosaminyltransferase
MIILYLIIIILLFYIVNNFILHNIEKFDNKPKIVDSFIFYNELDMLKFRLEELYDNVDYFVLVESTKTFTYKDKILYYDENKNLFDKYNDKIIHVIVDDYPENVDGDPWLMEKFQRNCINRGIEKLNLNRNDLIIISDVDEIPKISSIPKNVDNNIHIFEQDMYYYNLNSKQLNKWKRSKILTYDTYIKQNSEPDKIRNLNKKNIIINDGGWHLSYFGDVDFIMNKIKNFSHQEYNNDKYNNKDIIEKKLKNNENLFGNDKFQYIEIDDNDNLPKNYIMLVQ